MEPTQTSTTTISDLAALPAGTRGIIHTIGVGHGLARRLASLGLTEGAEVTVLQNYGSGPILILVRGARVAIGRGQARQILLAMMR